MDKKALRKELIARRTDMEKNVRKVLDEKIYNNLVGCEQVKKSSVILTYISTAIEVDTLRFAEEMLKSGRLVAVPKCLGREMVFIPIKSLSELVTSRYGVPEPESGEAIAAGKDSVCITPALAFDESFYRLGYGGGFYDRFLKDYEGCSIGLCYSEFIMNIPTDVFDIRTDMLITEQTVQKR